MFNQSLPTITVIVAVYNGVETLQQCIDSFAGQGYPSKELIVIDGASVDGTVDLIKANSQKIAYWISEPDLGIYDAWNKALAKAQGEWICFLGADDFLSNAQVLERMAAQLVFVPADIHVVYGQIMLVNSEGTELYPEGQPWEEVKERFKQVMCIPHPAVMHRRSLFVRNGNFDESFRIAGDYELLLRELKSNDAIFIHDLVMTVMRQGGVSTDPENTLVRLRELRLAQQKNLLPWGWVWFMALTRAYIRLSLWNLLGQAKTRRILDFGRRLMGLPAYWTKT